MIDRTKYPYLYWGWRLALPYNIVGWIYGFLIRLDVIPSSWGWFKEMLTQLFTPVMIPIVILTDITFGTVFWLLVQMASVLFLTWILISPIFGMFRLLIGLKN